MSYRASLIVITHVQGASIGAGLGGETSARVAVFLTRGNAPGMLPIDRERPASYEDIEVSLGASFMVQFPATSLALGA